MRELRFSSIEILPVTVCVKAPCSSLLEAGCRLNSPPHRKFLLAKAVFTQILTDQDISEWMLQSRA
jgi:hypothetical protein